MINCSLFLIIVASCIKLYCSSTFVNCHDTAQCAGDTINCPTNEDCIIDCNGNHACGGATFNCPAGYGCNITCSGGTQTCWGATINAVTSTELYLFGCAGDYDCENIHIYCPQNVFGRKKCHISGDNSGLTHCQSCDGELRFYAINGWLDMDFSRYAGDEYTDDGYGGPGRMLCLDGYTASCDIGAGWVCSGSTACDLTLNPTNTPTENPTASNATTAIPTTSMPTTSEPTTLPTTSMPTTSMPTTSITSTSITSTSITSTSILSTSITNTSMPTTAMPTTSIPTTSIPTTYTPTTAIPTTFEPTANPITPGPTSTTQSNHIIDTHATYSTDVGNALFDGNLDWDEFRMALWICLLSVVLICTICGIVILQWGKNRKMKKNVIRNEIATNIQLTTNKNYKNNVFEGNNGKKQTGMQVESDNDEFIINDINTPKSPNDHLIDYNLNDDEFIIDGDDDIISITTARCPQNEYIMNNNVNNVESTEGKNIMNVNDYMNEGANNPGLIT